jgi:5'(3')-deoxyribonucleotidase
MAGADPRRWLYLFEYPRSLGIQGRPLEMSENIVLLDMDGVVCDWKSRMERDLEDLLGPDKNRLPAITLTRIEYLIRRQPGWYLNLEPLPLGFFIAETLRGIGFSIMVATKASPQATNAWSEKVAWCLKHLPYAQVTVSEDKTLLYGKILVDDYQKNADPWLKRRPRGYVILPDQPWNQGYEHPRVKRVRTPGDVAVLRPLLQEIFERS